MAGRLKKWYSEQKKKRASSKPKGKKDRLGKYRGVDVVQKARRKKLGIKKGEEAGRVGSKAKKAVKTKGGTYVKYKKGSASAKSFGKTFKAKCAGGASSFTWQGRSYSCAKKSDTKKAAPAKKKEVQGPPVDTSKKGQKRQYTQARRGLHKAEGKKFYEKFSDANKAKYKKSKKTGKSAY